MVSAVIQTLLAAFACVLLFAAFRRLNRSSAAGGLVAIGLLLRAVTGQAAFWISYLRLDIARPMQLGGGFWFYGMDGIQYLSRAAAAAREGLGGIFSIDPMAVSPVYTQVLAVACALFGPFPSVAILLNAALFLATCAIVLAVARGGTGARAAVAGASLAPSLVLWTTQPMKDVFFVFLLTAFAGAAAWMIASWKSGERGLRVTAPAVAAIVVLYGVAGVRWYIVLALLCASALPLLVAAWRSPTRLVALALFVAVYACGIAALPQMASGYVPRAIQELFVTPSLGRLAAAPRLPGQLLTGARSAFEQLGGATRIVPGSVLRPLPPTAARAAAGTAALLLPPSLTRAAALCEISGGRGLWLFADLDSVAFALLLAVASVAVVGAFRSCGARSPLLWLVLLATAVIGVAIGYSVTNYGALLRYRSMLFALLALVPAVAAKR